MLPLPKLASLSYLVLAPNDSYFITKKIYLDIGKGLSKDIKTRK